MAQTPLINTLGEYADYYRFLSGKIDQLLATVDRAGPAHPQYYSDNIFLSSWLPDNIYVAPGLLPEYKVFLQEFMTLGFDYVSYEREANERNPSSPFVTRATLAEWKKKLGEGISSFESMRTLLQQASDVQLQQISVQVDSFTQTISQIPPLMTKGRTYELAATRGRNLAKLAELGPSHEFKSLQSGLENLALHYGSEMRLTGAGDPLQISRLAFGDPFDLGRVTAVVTGDPLKLSIGEWGRVLGQRLDNLGRQLSQDLGLDIFRPGSTFNLEWERWQDAMSSQFAAEMNKAALDIALNAKPTSSQANDTAVLLAELVDAKIITGVQSEFLPKIKDLLDGSVYDQAAKKWADRKNAGQFSRLLAMSGSIATTVTSASVLSALIPQQDQQTRYAVAASAYAASALQVPYAIAFSMIEAKLKGEPAMKVLTDLGSAYQRFVQGGGQLGPDIVNILTPERVAHIKSFSTLPNTWDFNKGKKLGVEAGRNAIFIVADLLTLANDAYAMAYARSPLELSSGAFMFVGDAAILIGDFANILGSGAKMAKLSTYATVAGAGFNTVASIIAIGPAVQQYQANPNSVAAQTAVAGAVVNSVIGMAAMATAMVCPPAALAFILVPDIASIGQALELKGAADNLRMAGMNNEAGMVDTLHTISSLNATPIINAFSPIYTAVLNRQMAGRMTTDWLETSYRERMEAKTKEAHASMRQVLDANPTIRNFIYFDANEEKFEYGGTTKTASGQYKLAINRFGSPVLTIFATYPDWPNVGAARVQRDALQDDPWGSEEYSDDGESGWHWPKPAAYAYASQGESNADGYGYDQEDGYGYDADASGSDYGYDDASGHHETAGAGAQQGVASDYLALYESARSSGRVSDLLPLEESGLAALAGAAGYGDVLRDSRASAASGTGGKTKEQLFIESIRASMIAKTPPKPTFDLYQIVNSHPSGSTFPAYSVDNSRETFHAVYLIGDRVEIGNSLRYAKIWAGSGNDMFMMNSGMVAQLDGGAGTNVVSFQNATKSVYIDMRRGSNISAWVGTKEDDQVVGTDGQDAYATHGGEDWFDLRAGNDVANISGASVGTLGSGDDIALFSAIAKHVDGGAGNDVANFELMKNGIRYAQNTVNVRSSWVQPVVSSAPLDALRGYELNWAIHGADEASGYFTGSWIRTSLSNYLVGGEAANLYGFEMLVTTGYDDEIEIGANDVIKQIQAGGGNDVIRLNQASNMIAVGGDGNDQITVTDGDNNSILAGNGNDSIIVNGTGNHMIDGGYGDDTIDLRGSKGNVQMSGGAGNDTIYLGTQDAVLNFGKDTGKDIVYDNRNRSGELVLAFDGYALNELTIYTEDLTFQGDYTKKTIVEIGGSRVVEVFSYGGMELRVPPPVIRTGKDNKVVAVNILGKSQPRPAPVTPVPDPHKVVPGYNEPLVARDAPFDSMALQADQLVESMASFDSGAAGDFRPMQFAYDQGVQLASPYAYA